MSRLKELSLRIHAVSVLRELLCDDVISAIVRFIDLPQGSCAAEKLAAFSEIAYRLYSTGGENLSRYIRKIVFESENAYVKAVGKGEVPSAVLEKSLRGDLKTFHMLASLSPEELIPDKAEQEFLPGWISEETDIETEYMKRSANIGKYGYGIYAKYKMFYINHDYAITPVKNPDTTQLSDLIDYEREQKIILENTMALLGGKNAANILLTGDAGTGKSSTIKAVANELYDHGLRIIEVRKEQLRAMPQIMDELNANPLKFILFIDDLSFVKDDDNFSALKAILEGSVSAKSNNVVIYATSNRRHLVKETFSDREGDDVHFNDTMQELLSLSERFGLQLTFQRPDKATYLDIVHQLAEKNGLMFDTEKLDIAAERFVLKRGTRSARAAKQFIDGILAGGAEDIG